MMIKPMMHDEIGVMTSSKYLAHMTGCWDPESEPSIEEMWTIDIIWRFSQFTFFSELALWGDFPVQSSTCTTGEGSLKMP